MQIHNFVNGKIEKSLSKRFAPVYNPATGEQTAEVCLSNSEETARAIAIAKAAQVKWGAFSPLKRARILFKFKQLVDENFDELAKIITLEHGKVYSDAKGELTRGLEVVEFACGIPHLLKGEFSNNVGTGVDSYSKMHPVGVCAGITPFNFPAMVAMWMYPVALACGNAFILKPSEKDPTLSIKIAELLKQAGLPDGVFNVINGDKETVDTLLTHPDVAAISFVGSTPIAKIIYETASKHGKRAQALGGAKNHMIIMPDADIDESADALMGSAYGSAGERCMAISVAVPVSQKTADELIEALKFRLKKLKVGNGLDSIEPQMGPLITLEHQQKVKSYIDLGVKEGAKLVVDGRNLKVDGFPNGFYLGGSLFDEVKPQMRIYQEEIFGPVLVTVRVSNFKEAVQLVNAHQFANGGAIFTRDGNSAREFTEQVEVGMLGVNVPIPVPMAFHSFGGWKNSLFGVNHVHGPDGVRFYTRMKTITTRWSNMARKENAFTMPTMT